MFDKLVPVGRDVEDCEECGGFSDRIYIHAPGVLIRPEGWDLSPNDPQHSFLPKKDREINRWQMGNSRQRR